MPPIEGRILAVAAIVAVTVLGCKPEEDWSNPEYVVMQMSVGEDRAFAEFSRLSDEQQRQLVPELIEIYNNGLKQEKVLTALLDAGDPAAREIFLAALERPSDEMAATAARGLAEIGATESATAVARRLERVTSENSFLPFLEALREMPTPQSSDIVAGVLLRRVQQIGGIQTVRYGCQLLGDVENPSSEVIAALVFSLVNFVPQPFQDAINECELALLEHGDAAVPKLAETFRGDNARVNDHLRNLQYQPVVGQLRAALVLSHIATDAAIAPFRAWVAQPHPLPRTELARLSVEEQQNWYSNSGQLFDVVASGLAYHGTPEDRAMLRRLESTGEEQLLNNFAEWFSLSDGAEVGLRQSVQEALFMLGNPEDRELFWERAKEGDTGRGGVRTAALLRLNALHYAGRAARADEMEKYEEALAAQEIAERDFGTLRAYWVLAQQCQDDPACYGERLQDPSPVLEDEAIAAFLASQEEGAARNAATTGVTSTTLTGAVWQLAVRLGDQPAAAEILVSNLDHGNMDVRMNIGEALLIVDQLPDDTAERITAFLDSESSQPGAGNPMLRDYRHALRVARQMRTR